MATVYLAEHPRISKRVAVKVIHPELAASPEMVSRFLSEARTAAQINHEHVVDILDFGQTPDGENFMIMEYLEGQSLSARVQAAGRLDITTTLHIGRQIAEALVVAHSQGVVHRDLKPDNIFLVQRPDNADFVKILDFGLAKLLFGAESLQHRTTSGSVLGTPHYMSPEQCEGRIAVDGRADLYSLGCVLFYMINGQLPFPGDEVADVLIKHFSHIPPSSRSSNPQVPLAIDKLILHCLAKNREYRFQSASELLMALGNPEKWSAEFGDDTIRILGPHSGANLVPLSTALPANMTIGVATPSAVTPPDAEHPASAVSARAEASPPTGVPSAMSVSSSLPPLISRPSRLLPILGRVAASRVSQKFLAMVPERRLLFLRTSAAGFACVGLCLLVLLLRPRHLPPKPLPLPADVETLAPKPTSSVPPANANPVSAPAANLPLTRPSGSDSGPSRPTVSTAEARTDVGKPSRSGKDSKKKKRKKKKKEQVF